MKNLKVLREKKGFSQEEVAKFIGVSRQMYNKYENSNLEPSVNSIRLLKKLYHVSYETLLDEVAVYSNKDNSNLYVASPSVAYGNGCGNYFSQMINLLPKLLYLEKAKLLNFVAQSMTKDVEAGKMAQLQYSTKKHNTTSKTYSIEEFDIAFAKIQKLATENNFNSNGQKWTREEMNER